MPTPHSAPSSTARPSSRPASKARNELLSQLKDDHQRVKKAYSKYRRLDAWEDAEARQALVQQVLDELSVHARLEEELLYPAAREQLEDCRQIDEAEVEHEMLHLLIDRLRQLDPEEEAQAAEREARFTVLCEYTLHHVKEEEREMFPQLMKARLDWLSLARAFDERRAMLKGEPDVAGPEEPGTLPEDPGDDADDAGGPDEEEPDDQDEDAPPLEPRQASRGARAGRQPNQRRGGPASR